MDYNDLKIKERYIGDVVMNNIKSFILSDDMSIEDKKYIYLVITKHVFTIFPDDIVETVEDKTKVSKVNKPKVSKTKTKK